MTANYGRALINFTIFIISGLKFYDTINDTETQEAIWFLNGKTNRRHLIFERMLKDRSDKVRVGSCQVFDWKQKIIDFCPKPHGNALKVSYHLFINYCTIPNMVPNIQRNVLITMRASDGKNIFKLVRIPSIMVALLTFPLIITANFVDQEKSYWIFILICSMYAIISFFSDTERNRVIAIIFTCIWTTVVIICGATLMDQI